MCVKLCCPQFHSCLFKVVVNGVEYCPIGSHGNKKTAKAQAAQTVLQSLGLVPRDTNLPVVIG